MIADELTYYKSLLGLSREEFVEQTTGDDEDYDRNMSFVHSEIERLSREEQYEEVDIFDPLSDVGAPATYHVF